jgi:hypothetical protein
MGGASVVGCGLKLIVPQPFCLLSPPFSRQSPPPLGFHNFSDRLEVGDVEHDIDAIVGILQNSDTRQGGQSVGDWASASSACRQIFAAIRV